MGTPGYPTLRTSAIRFWAMTTSTGPIGGAPVPSMIVTPRSIEPIEGALALAGRASGRGPDLLGGRNGERREGGDRHGEGADAERDMRHRQARRAYYSDP